MDLSLSVETGPTGTVSPGTPDLPISTWPRSQLRNERMEASLRCQFHQKAAHFLRWQVCGTRDKHEVSVTHRGSLQAVTWVLSESQSIPQEGK